MLYIHTFIVTIYSIFICTCTKRYIHTLKHAYVYAYIHSFIHMSMHSYLYIYTYIHTLKLTSHTHISYIHTYSPAYSTDPEEVFSWVGIIMYLPPSQTEQQRADIQRRFDEYTQLIEPLLRKYKANVCTVCEATNVLSIMCM